MVAALQFAPGLLDTLLQFGIAPPQMCIGEVPCAHIHHADQYGRTFQPVHAAARQLNEHPLAIHFFLGAQTHLLLEVRNRQRILQGGGLPVGKKHLEGQGGHLVLCHAVKRSGRFVERQNALGIGIEQPHRLGIRVKKTPIAKLAVSQQLQGPACVADILHVEHQAARMPPQTVLHPLVQERMVADKGMAIACLQCLLGSTAMRIGNMLRNRVPEINTGQARQR